MNGILCVNKPQDFTSFDVIAKLRGILRIKRLGHGGTLDPMATGVLPVFVGNATRVCDMMPDNSKSYRAGFQFGLVSDTQDITGKILQSSDIPVKLNDIESVIPNFTGDISQIPPMYSAVQVNGQRLYDLARQGVEVERPPRNVFIEKITVSEYNERTRSGILEIYCGKGTYVRTLINDIGLKLGCGGIMTSLVRTSSGGFTLDECHDFDEIQKAKNENCIEKLILPVERVFSSLEKLHLSEVQTRMYRNGVKLDLARVDNIRNNITEYSVYGYDGKFIGVARADFENNILCVRKNLA